MEQRENYKKNVVYTCIVKLQEECGIYMYSKILYNTRLLKSEFVGDPSILEVHVFTTDQFTGTVHESSEMKPQWTETTNILFDEMWPDNKYWFSMVLEGQKFAGYFLFEGHDKILKYTLDKVDTI